MTVENSADRKQVAQASRSEKRRHKRFIEDMKSVLSTVQGRRFVWGMLERCGVYSLSYTGDPTRTAFNEGMRNVGLLLIALLNECGDEWYGVMQKENSSVGNERQ